MKKNKYADLLKALRAIQCESLFYDLRLCVVNDIELDDNIMNTIKDLQVQLSNKVQDVFNARQKVSDKSALEIYEEMRSK